MKVEQKAIDRFGRIRVAGAITPPVTSDIFYLKFLEGEGSPIVLVGRSATNNLSVDVNNVKSGILVRKQFIHSGHRKIGFVYSGELSNIPDQN